MVKIVLYLPFEEHSDLMFNISIMYKYNKLIGLDQNDTTFFTVLYGNSDSDIENEESDDKLVCPTHMLSRIDENLIKILEQEKNNWLVSYHIVDFNTTEPLDQYCIAHKYNRYDEKEFEMILPKYFARINKTHMYFTDFYGHKCTDI